MAENGEISTSASSGVSTFLHNTEIGEAIKQTTFARETYLGEVGIFGLRNKEYLMENLQGLRIGDRVILYLKYNSEPPSSTAVQVSNIPDDGTSIRVHTLAGLCLGYVKFPERYIMAALMKAGKHLYAKVNSLNVPETIDKLDTRNAVTLDIYWVEESTPFKLANTYEIREPKNEAMEQNGNAILLKTCFPNTDFKYLENAVKNIDDMEGGDRLSLIWTPSEDDPDCIQLWNRDRTSLLGFMDEWDCRSMIAHMMEAGKNVYGVVNDKKTGEQLWEYEYSYDLYVEDT